MLKTENPAVAIPREDNNQSPAAVEAKTLVGGLVVTFISLSSIALLAFSAWSLFEIRGGIYWTDTNWGSLMSAWLGAFFFSAIMAFVSLVLTFVMRKRISKAAFWFGILPAVLTSAALGWLYLPT